MHLSDIRRLTPAVQRLVYFQTSGFSPKPDPVIQANIRWTVFQGQGPARPDVSQRVAAMLADVRRKVADSLNAHPDEIMLNENATVGINVVAYGIDWRPGDQVILSTHEHPGNRITWYNLTQRYGVRLAFLDASLPDDDLLSELDRALDSRTRLVSLSHVSRRTGRRLPARAIVEVAHRRDVPVLFDAAQAYGAIPVDVQALGCDFYTVSGHKYIMGPQGTGALYVRRDRLDWLKPSWIGSHSQKDMDDHGYLALQDGANRFEFGTRNLADQAGLGKALDLWAAVGWKAVFAYLAAYTDRLKAALQTIPGLVLETPLPYAQSSGIVTFHRPGGDAYALAARLLEEDGILVSPLAPTSPSVRVSTHVFNTDAEMERLVAALRRSLP